MSGKAPTYCRNCSRVINAHRSRYCAACRPKDIAGRPTKADALKGGRWVRRGSILRWEFDNTIHPKWWGLPACTTCGAEAGTPCRRPSGQTAMEPHEARVPVESACECGRPKPKRNTYCDPCALEVKRERWRKARATYLAKRQGQAA